MGQALYVKRDTAPSLIAGEEVMVTSRVKGNETASPAFFVVALEPGSSFDYQTVVGPVPDATGYTTGPTSMARWQRAYVSVPGIAQDHNIYYLRCLTGRIAVTFVSPHEARMQFRRWERKTA